MHPGLSSPIRYCYALLFLLNVYPTIMIFVFYSQPVFLHDEVSDLQCKTLNILICTYLLVWIKLGIRRLKADR